MVELPVVVRMVDDSCLLCPEGGRAASVEVDGVGHSEHMADVCGLIYGRTISLTLESAVYHDQIGIALIIRSECGTRIFRTIVDEYGTFYDYLKSFAGDKIIYETDKTTNDLSDTISNDLKKRGMKFVGSTIIYSYLQAIGMIYSHDKGCYLYRDEQTGNL